MYVDVYVCYAHTGSLSEHGMCVCLCIFACESVTDPQPVGQHMVTYSGHQVIHTDRAGVYSRTWGRRRGFDTLTVPRLSSQGVTNKL